MEKVNYKIFNPGGNKTAIVMGNKYTQEERKEINNFILKENLEVEQVGFLNLNEYELEMAGGEFCVNATRCAIYEYLQGKEGEIQLKVSGVGKKLLGGINKKQNVYAKMNIDKTMEKMIRQQNEYNIINLDGITLAVLDNENSKKYIRKLKQNEEETKLVLKEIMKEFDTTEKATGIILIEEKKEIIKIYPIIWVKTIDTLYYETACGSGSLAVAIYENNKNGKNNFKITQPSGYNLNVRLNIINNYLKDAVIEGKVMEEK